MKCVEVDLNGFVVESLAQTPPACSDFALVTAVELDKMTYWANLAIELDPVTGTAFYPLLIAFITAVGVVLGLRMVFDNLRTLTKEA